MPQRGCFLPGAEDLLALSSPAQKAPDGAVKTEQDGEVRELGCKRHSPLKVVLLGYLGREGNTSQTVFKSCALLPKQERGKKSSLNKSQVCRLVVMSKSIVLGVVSLLMLQSTPDCNNQQTPLKNSSIFHF